jgi:hypothetical protein
MRANYADYEYCLSFNFKWSKEWMIHIYAGELQEILNLMISGENVDLIQKHMSEIERI